MTETKRLTLAERIRGADPALYMSATHLGSFSRTRQGERWNHDRWRVTLRTDGRSLTTEFSMGDGHNGERPTTEQVLESLLLDALAAENTADFREFASEFGYEIDDAAGRRRAEGMYIACTRMAERLKRLLGDRYDAFMWETEPE